MRVIRAIKRLINSKKTQKSTNGSDKYIFILVYFEVKIICLMSRRRPRTQPSSPREKLDKRTCYSDVYPYRIQNPIMTEIEDDRLDLVSIEKINLRRESATQETNKAQDELKAAVKLNSLHVVQVDEYEMSKFERANMENSETARRLDLAESLSEMLANVALLAGSTDNITVNCILLPGAFTS